MSRTAWCAWALAAFAAYALGYGTGTGLGPATVLAARLPVAGGAAAPAAGPVVYYQDPDGKPVYSASPMLTGDGRAFRAVRASEDVSFATDEADAPGSGTDTASGMAMGGPPPRGGSRPILYYRNPMGLADTSPVPTKDSMGMDYIPVYADGDSDGSVVTVTPGRVQRMGVRTALAERRAVSRPVRVPGTVALDERRVTVVATRSDAYIDRVEDITTGDRIRRGQPLVQVYSPEINAAAAQLIANPGFDGARRRLQNLNVSPGVIDEMERTRRVPMAITWSSPRDGIVLQRNAVEGMKAPAGETLFRIADISVVWVLADVPERDLAAVRPGQRVTVRLRSAPGTVLSGTVAVVYPQVNPETRATRIRIELANPDGLLLPDMYADVGIETGDGAPVVAVPDDAIIETGEKSIVLFDRGGGRFEPGTVTTGVRAAGFTEIRAGVAEGERVVTAANFLIDAESNLKAALQSLTTPKETTSQDGRRATSAGGHP